MNHFDKACEAAAAQISSIIYCAPGEHAAIIRRHLQPLFDMQERCDKISELELQNAKLQNECGHLQADVKELQSALAFAESEREEMREILGQARDQLAASQQREETLREGLSEAEHFIEKGVAMRITDQWPALQTALAVVRDKIAAAWSPSVKVPGIIRELVQEVERLQGEHQEREPAKPIASIYFSRDGKALDVCLDNSVADYGEWIKGEGADIALKRSRDTHKICGAHLPLYAKTLIIGGDQVEPLAIDLETGDTYRPKPDPEAAALLEQLMRKNAGGLGRMMNPELTTERTRVRKKR